MPDRSAQPYFAKSESGLCHVWKLTDNRDEVLGAEGGGGERERVRE
jgi:hypothetical protein